MTTEVKEFDILGHKVRFSPGDGEAVSADEVVQLLQKETEEISAAKGYRGDSQTALLVALKIAMDKLKIEKEYRDNIDQLQSSVDEAMSFIEKFSIVPSEANKQ